MKVETPPMGYHLTLEVGNLHMQLIIPNLQVGFVVGGIVYNSLISLFANQHNHTIIQYKWNPQFQIQSPVYNTHKRNHDSNRLQNSKQKLNNLNNIKHFMLQITYNH